jgi:hypothetical protein
MNTVPPGMLSSTVPVSVIVPVQGTHLHVHNSIYNWRKNTQFWCSYMFRPRPRWRSWLRHCATNRQVAGSIPDGVSRFFHWHNTVGRTMALGSTQPLTEISTRNISWGVKAAGAYGLQPTTFMCRLSRNLGASASWHPVGLSRPVTGLLFTCFGHEPQPSLGRYSTWRHAERYTTFQP